MRTIILYLLAMFLSACSCEEQYICPPLSNSGTEWINKMHAYGDTIEYRNSLGESFKFNLKLKELSPSNLIDACQRQGFQCDCQRLCNAFGNLNYEPDSQYSNRSFYDYGIYERSFNGITSFINYSFNIFDLSSSINDEYYLSNQDSFYTSFTIDTTTYNNVFVFTVDTSLEYTSDQKVWKSYISIEEGIIAFWERPSNTLFVRQ